MYKFKKGSWVSELIEASSEAIARTKLAELLGCELRELPRDMEVFHLGEG